MKSAFFVILTISLLCGMLFYTIKIQPARADWIGNVWIALDGSVTPTAPIFTSDNITYSLTDNINGSIQVGRPGIILDGGGHTVLSAYTAVGVNAANVIIENMTVTAAEYGIAVGSEYDTILGNNVLNCFDGILIYRNHTTVIENNVNANRDVGIGLVNSFLGAFCDNNITDNSEGILLSPMAFNNSIFHNNFIGNSIQVDSWAAPNIWDNGYPSGGNYWSDYTGTDFFSGPYQNITGSDSIGDTPYITDVNNTDYYPLTNPSSVLLHEVALANVLPLKTVVGQGYNLNVLVTAANLGNYQETFNVTCWTNSTSLGPANEVIYSLPSGETANSTATFNTTGTPIGNYTVGAYASPVPGETNPANNNCTDGNVIVTIPGDINGDGKVNLVDLVLLANAYGSHPGDMKWNPNADINSNNAVDLTDLVIMANHYGQQLP